MTQYEKFKLGILIIFMTGFLFCFYGYSENGRYVYLNGTSIDSRTGQIYKYHKREIISISDLKKVK